MTNRNPALTPCPSCGARASGKFCHQCGAALAVGACTTCGATLAAGARFCNECGSGVSGVLGSATSSRVGTPTATGGLSVYAPWGVAALILVSVIGYFIGRGTGGSTTAGAGASPLAAPFANGGAGSAPDISNMAPRERASRLYDRIMRYVEEGKPDSVRFFAPMALASFEQLGAELDTDARYDYGRVASETGNLDIAAAQADTILRGAPNHLLGLALSARTATLRGDAGGAAKAWKTFLSVKDVELKKALPEYQMHAADVEQATRLAQGGK